MRTTQALNVPLHTGTNVPQGFSRGQLGRDRPPSSQSREATGPGPGPAPSSPHRDRGAPRRSSPRPGRRVCAPRAPWTGLLRGTRRAPGPYGAALPAGDRGPKKREAGLAPACLASLGLAGNARAKGGGSESPKMAGLGWPGSRPAWAAGAPRPPCLSPGLSCAFFVF